MRGERTDIHGGVDVVIPNLNGGELLLTCVRSLTEDPAVAEVIVVDDGSDDGSAEAAAAVSPRVRAITLTEHRGLAAAMNRGAEHGTATLLLFLNNDIVAGERSVSLLADALAAVPQAASAAGRLVDAGTTRTQVSYQPRAIPGLIALLVRITGIERAWPRNPWTGQHLTAPLDEHTPTLTDRQPAGACLLLTREMFTRAGGWDERYWFWYEDVDLSRRLLSHGRALYVPGAVFEHVGRASTARWRKHQQHRRLYHGTLVYGQASLGPLAQRVLGAAVAVVCMPRIQLARGRDQEALATYRALTTGALAAMRLRPVPRPDHGGKRP